MRGKEIAVVILALALSAMTLLSLSFPAFAATLQKVWLRYDDGTCEIGEAFSAGYMLAVRFTSPKRSLLYALKFYLVGSPAAFEVHVMNATTHEDLVTPFEVTPPREFSYGWLWTRLLRRRILLTVKDDFIVALKFVLSNMPVLGSDTSPPVAGRSEIYDPYKAAWSPYPVNLMIRAEIVYLSP